MNTLVGIGMDTAKNVFQLHGVDAAEAVTMRRQLRRSEMTNFFQKLPPTLVAIEACASSQHWARLLQSFEHAVKQARCFPDDLIEIRRTEDLWSRTSKAAKAVNSSVE